MAQAHNLSTLTQEALEGKASHSYRVTPCLKNSNSMDVRKGSAFQPVNHFSPAHELPKV